MRAKIRKILLTLFLFLILCFIGEVLLQAMFETPIMIDDPCFVNLDTNTQEISLKWFLGLLLEDEGLQMDGIDEQGKRYSWFLCELPDTLQAEIDIVVSWDTNSAKAYIGESKAMDIIKYWDFPEVLWNGRFEKRGIASETNTRGSCEYIQ